MSNEKRKEYTYQYKTAQGQVGFSKIERHEDGRITTYWSDPGDTGQLSWKRNLNDLPCEIVMYNSDKIAAARSVIILSSESEADRMNYSIQLSFRLFTGAFENIDSVTATCIPGDKWDDAYCVALANKDVTIIPRAGERTQAKLLAKRLHNKTTRVRIVELPFTDSHYAKVHKLGFLDWFQYGGNADISKIAQLLRAAPYLTADELQSVEGEESILDALGNIDKYGADGIIQRISSIRSKAIRETLVQVAANRLGLKPDALRKKLEDMAAEKGVKIRIEEEASELRLPGLVDIAHESRDSKKKVFIILDKTGKLQSVPYIVGYNEQGAKVRFIPPKKTSFLLPIATEVLNAYEKNDGSLFADLLRISHEYVDLKEIDRLIMVSTIFTSYIIHHPDVHYLPIVFMSSEPNRGKSHILKFTAFNGYRGKWWRTFNLAACQRYNDGFHSINCLDVEDFAKSISTQNHMDFVLGKIEKGCTIPKVNRPSAERYDQSDEYDPYGLLVVGSNTQIPGNFTALKTRLLPIENILSRNKAGIKKPDDPRLFLEFRNRLTAWKAKMMQKRLSTRGHIDFEGRLYDMGETFLMVLNEVAPQYYDMMVDYLKKVERRRLADLSETGEAVVLTVIRRMVSEESAAHFLKTGNKLSTVMISQRRLIDEVQKVIPKLTSRGIMSIFRDKFGFTEEPIKRSHDYIRHVDIERLHGLLEAWGLADKPSKNHGDALGEHDTEKAA